jgi:signal transduction histidine kinase
MKSGKLSSGKIRSGKLRSIKTQLIASVLLVELAAAVCGTGLAFLYERHAHFRAFDVMLRGRADSLLGAVQDAEDPGDNVMLDGSEASLPRKDIYEVWDEKLRVLGHSTGWSVAPDTAAPAKPFAEIEVAGRQYRTIRVTGMRIVDPGDKGGGIPRRVTIIYGSKTHPVWEEVWRAVLFYGLSSLAFAVVTGVAMFWLLRRGLAPLDELAVQAAGVSVRSWEFEPSERVRGIAELAPLANALETAMRGLERSFNLQHQFVSDAAHELKTAVAVVKSSLQLLTMKPRAAAEYETGLERLREDCGRMEEIVAKMLTLARVEGDATAGSAAVANVGEAMNRIQGHLASLAEAFGVTVIVSVSVMKLKDGTEGLFGRIAPDELELLLSNLLMNALQHSEAGDAVRVTATWDSDWVELRIEDEGDGIAAEALPHVFDRFYRSDPSRSRHTGGTGLGLAICKAIVTRCRGTIAIESTVAVGTTVVVRLPIAMVD